MSEMLEKVARAIATVETGVEGDDDFFREHAIAAVRAIEFTDEEIGAAIEATGVRFGFGVADFRIAHKHLVDSILSTPTTRGEVK